MLIRSLRRFSVSRLMALAAALFILAPAGAATAAEPSMVVTDAWARAPLLPGRPGAAYFVIENHGDADRLVEVRTDAAGRTEIHTHVHEDSVMKMRKLPGLDIPAAAKVAFEPRGHHVMLFDPASGFRKGAEIALTLVFEHAGEITVAAPVHGMKSGPEAGHDDH